MAQYPIPQFIEQEGKIIFFLTFKQFFWLTGGIATCMIIYFVLPFYFFVVLSIIIMVFSGVLAFVKINNASLITAFFNVMGFVFQNKSYTWTKKEAVRVYEKPNRPSTTDIAKTPRQPIIPMVRTSKLQAIKKMIDTKK